MPKKTKRPLHTYKVGPCRPVFKTDQEMQNFFDTFREEVRPDLQELARARQKGAERIFFGLE